MKKQSLVIASLLLLALPTIVLAHDVDKNQDRDRDREELEFSLEASQGEAEEDSEDENEFEIKGIIESTAEGSFVVNGKTIYIDVTQVAEIKQKGLLEVGAKVKVEGEIKDGKYYAEEIKIIGEGQGRFKFEVEGVSITLSPTPTQTLSGTPTPTPTGNPTPITQIDEETRVSVKASGPISMVTSFLEQVLAYLKSLVA